MNDIHPIDVEDFIKNVGIKNADRVLKVLSKTVAIHEAVNTPLGAIFLKEITENINVLIGKIIDETATDQEKADFRAYKRIAESWANKIMIYKDACNQIKDTNNKLKEVRS